ncbi:MAG: hypothetical protein ACE14T_11180 [Syntrophales bacterium]
MSKTDDLSFLYEMRTRLNSYLERNDPTQIEMVKTMIGDWIRELEEKAPPD